MADLDFQGRAEAIKAVLQADPRLETVTIMTDLDEPTADMMDWIGIRLPTWQERPYQITNGNALGAAYDIGLTVEIVCTAVSHESTGNAAKRRNTLVNTVRNVLLDHQQLGGANNWLEMTGGQLDPPYSPAEGAQGSCYATGILRVLARCLA